MEDRIWEKITSHGQGTVGKTTDSANPQQVILKLEVPKIFIVVANPWK